MTLQRMNNRNEPSLRAVPMNVFPTLGSLQEVVDLANSKLPITNRNEMHSLLMIFQNTMLKVLHEEKRLT